jgi:carbon-monoxide dehydrogenase medium subunit
VKPPSFEYARPRDLPEALELRAELGYDSAILAGGQSLIPLLNFRLARPQVLIDLGGIRGLAYVEARDGGVAVGAMARQRDLELDDHAARVNPLVRETLQLVAHPVVRNRGTICGSIAHADSSAELPTLFTTIDGQATAVGPSGERMLVGGELFQFHMTNALQPDELIREVWFPPLPPRTGYAYVEMARRHGDYALAGVCCTVTLDGDGAAAQVRLGYGGVAPRPVRATTAEELMRGVGANDEEAMAEAGQAARDVVEASDDHAASSDFRRHLVATLTVRALRLALARAHEEGR